MGAFRNKWKLTNCGANGRNIADEALGIYYERIVADSFHLWVEYGGVPHICICLHYFPHVELLVLATRPP